MIATTKLDTTEHRQSVHLPTGCERPSSEVWFPKDDTTSEITLSLKLPGAEANSLQDLYYLSPAEWAYL